VSGLIGFTVISSGWLSYKAINYYFYKKPIMAEAHRIAMQEKILEEQSVKEMQLIEESKQRVVR